MSDPRATVEADGVRPEYDSYIIDGTSITYSATAVNGSAGVGLAVTLSGNKTISLVGDGEEVEGKLIKVEDDGIATVQTGGRMALPGGDGATLTPGKKIVGDLNASAEEGYIREVDTATAAELGVCRGRIVDAAVTTEVVVDL